jgi:thioredoxin-dependent peroxiredoxin
MATKKTTIASDESRQPKSPTMSRTRWKAQSKREATAMPRPSPSVAGSKAKTEGRLDAGAALPAFTLEDQRGKPFPLASLRGKLAVLYFYPKDDTPGCTREACAFQAELSSIARLGATVVGISPDPAVRHARFAEKYALKFPLLVDANREFANACGVLVPKTLYGKTSIGIERSTFIVDARGVVQRVWRKVKVDGHVDEVVAALRTLGHK